LAIADEEGDQQVARRVVGDEDQRRQRHRVAVVHEQLAQRRW